MRFLILLCNPSAENPTAGMRGLLALAIGLSAPTWIDWRTDLFPLAAVLMGGVITGLQLLSLAERQNWHMDGESR